MSRNRIRWGDTLEDDDEEQGVALPPTTSKGPDSHGVKTVTEFYKNDRGDAFKKVTKSKVVHVEKKVYKVGWRAFAPVAADRACCLLLSSLHSCVRAASHCND